MEIYGEQNEVNLPVFALQRAHFGLLRFAKKLKICLFAETDPN